MSGQTTVTSSTGGGTGLIELESLGLSFRLPASFTVADDPELAFLARSNRPPAILSIAEESSDVAQHEAERGETVSEVQLGSVDALVVTDAVLEGIPAGIVANELLVSNGSQSFSLPCPRVSTTWRRCGARFCLR